MWAFATSGRAVVYLAAQYCVEDSSIYIKSRTSESKQESSNDIAFTVLPDCTTGSLFQEGR